MSLKSQFLEILVDNAEYVNCPATGRNCLLSKLLFKKGYPKEIAVVFVCNSQIQWYKWKNSWSRENMWCSEKGALKTIQILESVCVKVLWTDNCPITGIEIKYLLQFNSVISFIINESSDVQLGISFLPVNSLIPKSILAIT